MDDDEASTVLKVLRDRGLTIDKLTVTNSEVKGDNYNAEIRRVEAVSEGEPIKLISKMFPKNDISAFQVRMFEKEIYIYDEVIPELERIQNEENIVDSDRIVTPKCYGTKVGFDARGMILEDMSFQGYEMKDRRKGLDWDHISLILGNLARLHGLSYVMKARHAEKFTALMEGIKNTFLNENNIFTIDPKLVFVKAESFKMAINSTVDPAGKTLLGSEMDKAVDRLYDMLTPSVVGATSVFCHGDTWTNNFLYKYNKNGSLTRLCFLDWQMARFTSPLTDIMYTIWTSTDEEFRRKYYDKSFEYYHHTLKEHLANFGIDVEHVYGKNQFMEDRKKYIYWGFFWAIFAMPLFLADPENIPDELNGKEDTDNSYARMHNSDYVDRINGVVRDFVRYTKVD